MDKFCVNKKCSFAFSPLRKANKNFVTLNLFQNLKIFSEPASLCGENALRSEQSPAMLTQSQVCSSHTLLRKSAFSLAETMVVMVIVAILMAAAAPLVAKKMSNDSKRLISTDVNGQQVYVAAGSDQVLSVGSNNKKDLKLKVNGNTEMNGDLTIINKPADGDPVNLILTADGIKTKPTSGDEQYLFQINPTSRETNVEIAIPDYSKMKEGTNNPVKVTDNGFVYVSNSIKGFKYQNNSDGLTGETTNSSALNDATSDMIVDLTAYQEHFYLQDNDVYVATRLPLLVPVSKDTYFQCLNGDIKIHNKDGYSIINIGSTYFNSDSVLFNNKCYFIPLAKARATTISEE